MSEQQILRLRNPALLMALAAAFPVFSYAAGAANVNFSSGSVTAVNAVGVQRPLTKGAEISNGDTIRTGDGGRAQLRFSDGAMVSLQPETEFRVDNYQYSGKPDGQERGFFSLLKGGLRTITGFVGRSSRDNYKVTTGVATIGIRGTEYAAGLNSAGDVLDVATGEGLVEVCNAAGCILLAGGESGTVLGAQRAPQRSHSRPRLPVPPPSLFNDLQPVYSEGDQVTSDGFPAVGSSAATVGGIVGLSGGKYANNASVTLNGDGSLNSFTAGGLTSSQGTAQMADFNGSDPIIKWGRWTNGNITLDNTPTTLAADQGFHHFWGTPTATMPTTGTGTFSLLGATNPTKAAGLLTPGTLSSASMSVNFGAQTFNLSLAGTISGVATNFSATGSGSISGNNINNTSISGLIGACGASGSVDGKFFGTSAERAGIAYKLSDGFLTTVIGAAALKQ